jgi:hypothetical protein
VSKTTQLLAAGLVAAMVGTALFLPGRQTVQGIQATGTAGSGLIQSAEGQG